VYAQDLRGRLWGQRAWGLRVGLAEPMLREAVLCGVCGGVGGDGGEVVMLFGAVVDSVRAR
jgi:hypothetical protein